MLLAHDRIIFSELIFSFVRCKTVLVHEGESRDKNKDIGLVKHIIIFDMLLLKKNTDY